MTSSSFSPLQQFQIAESPSWDIEYRKPGLRDWELLPVRNMSDAVRQIKELDSVRKIAELGCGRGLRALAMLLTIQRSTNNALDLCGIDRSASAIAQATTLLETMSRGSRPPAPFDMVFDAVLLSKASGISSAKVRFECADLFRWLPRQPEASVDLVIDWMCFHEIEPPLWPEYAHEVARVCNKHFLLNTFSVEGASVLGLGQVANTNKYQHSEQDLVKLFGFAFAIVSITDHAEDLNPVPRHTDGIVAAKRTYLFRRH